MGKCSAVARILSVGGAVASFQEGALCKKRKLLELQMVLGLRFGAGAATSDADGAGAPALATGLCPTTLSSLHLPAPLIIKRSDTLKNRSILSFALTIPVGYLQLSYCR